jgi:hypothetical protein
MLLFIDLDPFLAENQGYYGIFWLIIKVGCIQFGLFSRFNLTGFGCFSKNPVQPNDLLCLIFTNSELGKLPKPGCILLNCMRLHPHYRKEAPIAFEARARYD